MWSIETMRDMLTTQDRPEVVGVRKKELERNGTSE